jgi:D-alanyl-D-alanine carboxypeptidase
MIAVTTNSTYAAPYAAVVMDARTGQILHSRNADTRLHPASLTKMMTLYVVFQAIERGEITLDTKVKVSRNAANEPPSKLGLRAGQKIALRYLIRAAAVKSANDAATAMGEAISGSEAAFARRMTETGRRLGMKHSTFKNANGLTRSGHLSTARDMTILGRRLFYDYPQYYNLFSRRSTDAGIRTVYNTNRKLLKSYRGLDGIKTGYTNAAGFNLVSSAHHGNKHVIATVFGGKTSSWRNARIAKLLDMGFSRVDTRLAEKKPVKIAPTIIATQPKTIKVAANGAVRKSPVPKMRATVVPVLVAKNDRAAVENAILQAVNMFC